MGRCCWGRWAAVGKAKASRRQMRMAFAARRRLLGNGSLRFGRDDRRGGLSEGRGLPKRGVEAAGGVRRPGRRMR